MLVKDFIKGPMLSEIERMTISDCGLASHPYLGFQLICTSIEFLGACLDQYSWSDTGLSEKRFRLCINKLFDKKYHEYNTPGKFDLYSNLRCSLVHSCRPGNKIGLSERKHETSSGTKENHLKNNGTKLILIYEDFLMDFKDACIKLISMIDNREIDNEKTYTHIISVPNE